ncbi:phosphoglucosamine mutase [Candidatus Micrarchaeota archaeon]|nr:phosphoglucosamine mutase [Candidatus Micrarchaeota archaeon]
MAKYFGTNGIRGTFDKLNPSFALKAAQAIGIYFNRGKILVARDHRKTSELLTYAVLSGLQSVGCQIVDLGLVSTPTAEFMVERLKPDGLIIITGSHNTPEWNALKVMDGNGSAISKERGEKIERMIDGEVELVEWDKVKPGISYSTATREHIDTILSYVKPSSKPLYLILDLANGSPITIASELFKKMNIKITTINSNMDGTFPGRPSEPTEENVAVLKKMVVELKADGGIAWDGDGDRVIFVDEKGNFIVGDRVFGLCEYFVLQKKKGDVVTTVATSRLVEDIADQFSVKTVYTKVGAPYLSKEMEKKQSVIGGEEVGGVVWPEVSLAKDGFLTAAFISERMREKPLSELLSAIPFYYNMKIKISCPDEKKPNIISELKKQFDSEGIQYIDVDGLRFNLPDGWVIVRASGTENYIRVFAEAKSKENAESYANKYRKRVEEIINA